MTNDIAVPNQNLPSYLPQGGGSRLDHLKIGGQSLPGLSIKGKRFTLTSNREAIRTFMDKSGKKAKPIDELTGVFLDAHYDYQRDKYFTKFDPNDEDTWGAPACHSNGDDKPSDDAVDPQSADCSSCQWNSRNNKDLELDDKCSPYRNAIFLVFDPDDDARTALCRLKINSTSCFGSQERDEGLLNFDTLLREFSSMGHELYYHPVTISLDMESDFPKLHFTLHDEYVDEATYNEIAQLQKQYGVTDVAKGWSDYTVRTIYVEDEDGQASESETEKAPKQRAARQAKSDGGKETTDAQDEEAGDDEGKPAPTRGRGAGRGRASRGSADKGRAGADDAADESEDGGSAGTEESGDLSEDSEVQNMLNEMNL